jgi:succinoglycan biosynthesis transport protein ExoP
MLKTHLKRVTFLAIIGAIIGGAVYSLSPKVYEGSVQLLIATEPTATNSAVGGTDAASIISTGVSQSVGTEVSILRSRGLFTQALGKLINERKAPAELARAENLDPLYTILGERESRAAMVVVKAHDPDLAANLANTIYDVYNDVRQKSSDESIAHAQDVLENQSERVKTDLQVAENNLKKYKVENGIADLTSKSGQLVAYQSTLTQALDTAKADLAVQQATLTATRSHLNDRQPMATNSYVTQESPVVTRLQDQIATLESNRAEALRTYVEGSSKIQNIDSLIESTKQRLVLAQKDAWRQTSKSFEKDAVRQSFEDTLITGTVNKASLGRKIAALNAALNAVNNQVKQLPQSEMKLAELTRNQQILENKYRGLQTALGDLKYKGSAGIQQARMLWPAQPNSKPVAPDLARLLIVCTMGGAIVGFLYSLARESLRATAQRGTFQSPRAARVRHGPSAPTSAGEGGVPFAAGRLVQTA